MEVEGKTCGHRWNCSGSSRALLGPTTLGTEKLMANIFIVEPVESTRKRLERSLPKDHEDRIAGKGFNSLSHHNLVHKFMPIHQAMQIPDAKAAVDKECEKRYKLPAWQMTKVMSKNKGHSGSTKIAKNSPCYLEEWLRVGEDSTGDMEKIILRQFLRLISQRWYVVQKNQVAPSNTNKLWKHFQHRDQWRSLMRLPGSYLDPRVRHPSGRERRHHCLPKTFASILFTRSSSVLSLNAWSCRFLVKRSCRAMRMWFF